MAEKLTIGTCKILRTSIHTFLTNFHHFTLSPVLLCLPFSLFLLLHLSTCSLHLHLHSLLISGGFPITSPVSDLLILKLSEAISSSLSSLPLSLTFLLLSKSSTIQFLRNRPPSPVESAYFTLLYTQICNLFTLVAVNSACFILLCFAFSSTPEWASASIAGAGAVIYSIVVANSIVLCNLSLIASGWEGNGGFISVFRACILIRNRASTALFLSLPAKLAMAATEVVFRYRIYGSGAEERSGWAVGGEAMLIAYLYSVLIVGDTIVGCLFYTSCKKEDMDGKVYGSDLI